MMLRKPSTQHATAGILMQNLFIALTSLEMIALTWLLSILHVSVCIPFCYLVGKTHEFAEYNWGVADMSRVLDTLHSRLNRIVNEPSLILDPLFMMSMFSEFQLQLPPFKEYWEMLFKHKQMKVIARKDGSKVVHYGRLQRYLFASV